MARVDTQRAIGAVTMLLRDHLSRRGFEVSVGKPEQASATDTTAKLNLFLYETVFDASLRNHRLDEEGPPPLWLVLRYLVTAFDGQEQSDSPAAHQLLGQGLVALHELNFLLLDSAVANSVRLALQYNPEPLKITFEESTPDLLSKLMQGPDETYRLSTAVQVRPVMLLPAEPPRYSLLVGVDYTTDPISEIGEEGIGIDALPTLGARIERVEPSVFEPGEVVTVFGSDLHLGGLEAVLGDEPLQVVGQWSDRLAVMVESIQPGPGGAGRIAAGLGPSAGELPLKVREPRPGGRYRSSNLITGALRPVVSAAVSTGDLVIDGILLGRQADDVIVALFSDGAVVRTFDTVTTTADQTRLTVAGVQAAAGAGTYRVILKVNGMQARMSPQVVVPWNLAVHTRTDPPPLGFQPRLAVDDPLAAHWLGQVTLRLRREIAWLWHERGTLGRARGGGTVPPFTDGLSDTLDLLRWDADRREFFAEDEAAHWLSARIVTPPPAVTGAPRGSFAWTVAALQLGDVDCFALAVALGGAPDSARGSVIAACLNDPAAVQPTLTLVQRLWDSPSDVLGLLDPGHPLTAFGLLDPPPVHWQSSLEVAPIVARQLLYPSRPPPGALQTVEPVIGEGERATETELEFAAARLKIRAADRVSLVPVTGPVGSPRAETAACIAKDLGMPLLRAEAADPMTLASVMVTAWLRGAALYLPFRAVAAKEAELPPLGRLPLVVFVGMDAGDPMEQLPPQLTHVRVRLEPIGYGRRLSCWRRELPDVWVGAEGRASLTECARRFRYEGATISRVAAAVRTLARVPDRRELFEACRADLDLGDLAQPVAPRFELDELMLPARQTQQIRELVTATAALTTVHHEWGTARAWNESGLSVLFSGPPGTGKTMAAEAIARAIDMPIFRIDLSQIVNKYIGETEKNLRRLFDAADAADVILFFDEADALFGKRTEVKDAHDRYANLEISYLLERMERFKGMAVLASNRKKDLDEAFMRRLRYVVQFPLPGPEERLRIWRSVLPVGVDCEALDLEFLAGRIQLSGGHIRSAVFNACLQSVRPGATPRLGMAAVVCAVKDEFDKLGRAVSLDQFGRYAEYVRE